MENVFAQALAGSGVVGLIFLGIFILIQIFLNKRLRTPADRLAEAQFSVQIWKDQLAETKADRQLLETTISTLRAYVSTLETASRADQETFGDLHRQLRALEARGAEKDQKIRELNWRIEWIAGRVEAGHLVTLADLGRELPPTVDPIVAP